MFFKTAWPFWGVSSINVIKVSMTTRYLWEVSIYVNEVFIAAIYQLKLSFLTFKYLWQPSILHNLSLFGIQVPILTKYL